MKKYLAEYLINHIRTAAEYFSEHCEEKSARFDSEFVKYISLITWNSNDKAHQN